MSQFHSLYSPNSRLRRWRHVGVALSLMPVMLAHAQDESETTRLEDVTVQAYSLSDVTEGTGQYTAPRARTATKLDLSPRETPQSLSVITRSQIEDFNLDTANDVLESTPGVTVERLETDRTYYTSRGFEVSNSQIDGLRTPMPYNNVHGDVDMAIYDRVEVVRGATGLMSGSGNPAATVNYIRKRPTPELQASLAATVGSWDHKRVDADVSGPLNEAGSVRGRLVFSGMDGNSYLDRLKRERKLAYGVVEADLTEATRLALGFTWQDNDTDGNMWGALPLYDSAGIPTRYDRSTSSGPRWSYWNTDTQRSFAELNHALNERWELSASLMHLDMESDTNLFYIAGLPDANTGRIAGSDLFLSKYDRKLDQWVADVNLTGQVELFGRDHELVFGTDWSRSRNRQSSLYGPTAGDLPPLDQWDGRYPEPSYGDPDFSIGDATLRERSVYGATKLDLSERLTGVVGTRVSWINNTGQQYGASQETDHDRVLTPYAGLIFDINDWSSLYASYTEIFQPQTELGRDGDLIDPIEGESTEVGIKAELFDGRADAGLALFRIDQKNVAVPTGENFPGTSDPIYEGEDGLTSQGVELTLAGEIARGWQMNFGYTYLDVENADGDRAETYIPRHMLTASTSYRLRSVPQLRLGARVRWQDDIDRERDRLDGRSKQDAYALVDLMASYDIDDNLTASVNLNNVTDKKYLTSLKWDQAFYGAPRNVQVQLNWRY